MVLAAADTLVGGSRHQFVITEAADGSNVAIHRRFPHIKHVTVVGIPSIHLNLSAFSRGFVLLERRIFAQITATTYV
jgi:hypothetical protein